MIGPKSRRSAERIIKARNTVVVVVVVVVVVTLTRIIKSAVTGIPQGKTEPKSGTRIVYIIADAIHASARKVYKS